MFKKKSIILDVKLHCPDGLDESLGFHLPEELDEFLRYISKMSKVDGFSFTIKRTSVSEMLASLKQ